MRMKGIKRLPLYFGGLAAVAFALGASSAFAQEICNHDLCRQASPYPPEQLDRDGHALNM